MNIEQLGWTDKRKEEAAPFLAEGLVPARITEEQKNFFFYHDGKERGLAKPGGRFFLDAVRRIELPAVGDWVMLRTTDDAEEALVEQVLARETALVRKTPGHGHEEQVIASNIDYVLIASSLNRDLNPRRMERYLTLVGNSGATPVIVLTKADLCDDIQPFVNKIAPVIGDTPCFAINTLDDSCAQELAEFFAFGKTATLIGSSGVGKSSLINTLMGKAVQDVNEIRKVDGRGRHTTTARSMLFLPSGGTVIDTPGMREIQMWIDGDGLEDAYPDIVELAKHCKFRDCKHHTEPDCAVLFAVDEGVLDERRFYNYLTLVEEIEGAQQREKLRESAKERKHNKYANRFRKKKREKFNYSEDE